MKALSFKKSILTAALLTASLASASASAVGSITADQYVHHGVDLKSLADLGIVSLDKNGLFRITSLSGNININVDNQLGAVVPLKRLKIDNRGNIVLTNATVDELNLAKKAGLSITTGGNNISATADQNFLGNSTDLHTPTGDIEIKVDDLSSTNANVTLGTVEGLNGNQIVVQTFGTITGLDFTSTNGSTTNPLFVVNTQINEGGSDYTKFRADYVGVENDAILAAITKSGEANQNVDLNGMDGIDDINLNTTIKDTGSATKTDFKVEELEALKDLTLQVSSQVSSVNNGVDFESTSVTIKTLQESLGDVSTNATVEDATAKQRATTAFAAGINSSSNELKGINLTLRDGVDLDLTQIAKGNGNLKGKLELEALKKSVVSLSLSGNSSSNNFELESLDQLGVVDVRVDQKAYGKYKSENFLGLDLGKESAVSSLLLVNSKSNEFSVPDGIGEGRIHTIGDQVFTGDRAESHIRGSGIKLDNKSSFQANLIVNLEQTSIEGKNIDYLYNATRQFNHAESTHLTTVLPELTVGNNGSAGFNHVSNSFSYEAAIAGGLDIGGALTTYQQNFSDMFTDVRIGNFSGENFSIGTMANVSDINIKIENPAP